MRKLKTIVKPVLDLANPEPVPAPAWRQRRVKKHESQGLPRGCVNGAHRRVVHRGR